MEPLLKESASRVSNYDKEFLLDLYMRMFRIREFEEQVKFLFLEGSMPGTIHQCQGQEATAVGICTALNTTDFITSTHRPHGHALAKGLTCEEILLELFGKSTGCCGGKGGSMHIGNMEKGMLPAIAIVGGGIPLGTGMALAHKMKKTGQVVATFFGEGASQEGAFHEGVNMGAIWNLPIVYVCENNIYGASTAIDKISKVPCVADRAVAYGIRGQRVQGNDVLAVYEAARQAVHECREGKGPVLLELLTYRLTGHSRRDTCDYQPVEEKQMWSRRDPIKVLAQALLQRDDITENQLQDTRDFVEQEIEAAIEVAKAAEEPTLADLTTDVFV